MKRIVTLLLTLSLALCSAAISPVTRAASSSDALEETETAVALSAEDIPELISAESIAAHGHTTRIRGYEKDLYTAVFGNEDGTITEYVFSEPIKYVDAAGTVKDKHVSLEPVRGEYHNAADNDIAFSAAQDVSQGATLSYDDASLKIAPSFLGGRSVSSCLQNGKVVFSGSADLASYSVAPHINGTEHHVIIPSDNSIETFAFEVTAVGLNLANDTNGGIVFEKDGAETVFSLTPPVITDADGRFAFCDVTITASGRGTYILTVDASAFADDPNIQYPLDMTYSVNVFTSDFYSFVSTNLYSQPYGGTVYYLLLGHLGDVNNTPVYGMSQLRMTDFTSRLYFYNDCNLVSATLNLYCYNNYLLSFMSAEINGFAGYTGGVVDYNNVVLDNTVPAAYENSIYPGSYTAFNVLDFMKYWRKSSNAAQNGWILSVFNYPGYSVYFTSPYGTSSQRPYLTLTYSPRVNLNIPSNEYVIYDGTWNLAIKHFNSGYALTLDAKDVMSALQRMYIELYSATDATYTIKDPQGNRYLTVNTNKQVYFNSAPATGPQDSQLWYIVQLSDGSVQFWPKQYDGHALSYIPGSMVQFEVTTDVDDAKTKWRLQSYRIWYSQVSSQNSWDATNLNHLYFTGDNSYVNKFLMQDNTSGDLMDAGCAICSATTVLRNLDLMLEGIDYRQSDWYEQHLWSDPFTAVLANCDVDFSQNVTYNNGNLYLEKRYKPNKSPVYVYWSKLASRFGATASPISCNSSNYQTKLDNAISNHPEGVCVKFSSTGHTHFMVFYEKVGYNDYIICNPGTNNPNNGNKVLFSDTVGGWELTDIEYIVTFAKANS